MAVPLELLDQQRDERQAVLDESILPECEPDLHEAVGHHCEIEVVDGVTVPARSSGELFFIDEMSQPVGRFPCRLELPAQLVSIERASGEVRQCVTGDLRVVERWSVGLVIQPCDDCSARGLSTHRKPKPQVPQELGNLKENRGVLAECSRRVDDRFSLFYNRH